MVELLSSLDYMSRSKSVKDWNSRRQDIINKMGEEAKSMPHLYPNKQRSILSAIDSSGLIVEVLGADKPTYR